MTAALNRREMVEALRQFGREGGSDYRLLVVLATIVVVVMTVLLYRRWVAQQSGASSPMQVFTRIAGSLGLQRGDRRLLCRIAAGQSLPTPLALIVSPGTLGHHARRYARRCRRGRGVSVLTRAAHLRRALFGPVAGGGAGGGAGRGG